MLRILYFCLYTHPHTYTYINIQTIIDEAQIVATDLYGEGMSPRDQQRFMFEKNSVSVWDLGMYTLLHYTMHRCYTRDMYFAIRQNSCAIYTVSYVIYS